MITDRMIEAAARAHWNALADEFNQWTSLSEEEKAEQIHAMKAALEAAEKLREPEWNFNIDEAPKDGTDVLLYHAEGTVIAHKFFPMKNWWRPDDSLMPDYTIKAWRHLPQFTKEGGR